MDPTDQEKVPADDSLESFRLGAKNQVNQAIGSWARQQLPLQNETTLFILLNVMDIFLTYLLIAGAGGQEVNPVANFFLRMGGFSALIAYKMSLVAFVCVVAQFIAKRNMLYARAIFWIGIAVVGFVVFYSLRLLIGVLS